MKTLQQRLADHQEDVPLHFEGVALRSWIGVVGWPYGIVSTLAGLVGTATADLPAIRGAAFLLAVTGGLVLLGLVRCRRFETTLTSRLLGTQLGPFRRRLPLAFVVGCAVRPCTRWRRLYADRELVLALRVEGRIAAIPSREPEELMAAVQGAVAEIR